MALRGHKWPPLPQQLLHNSLLGSFAANCGSRGVIRNLSAKIPKVVINKRRGRMPSEPSPSKVAAEIRAILKRDGSAEHAKGVQWFFKEDVKSHGWYTASLRSFARQCRREILKEHGLEFLVQVADELF